MATSTGAASKANSAQQLDKATVLKRITIARHILGLLAGLLCGGFGVIGFVGVIAFAATNILLVLAYYTMVLGVDADEHGGHGQFTNEGLMPALAVFVV